MNEPLETREHWEAYAKRRRLMDREGQVFDDPHQQTFIDVPLYLTGDKPARRRKDPNQMELFR